MTRNPGPLLNELYRNFNDPCYLHPDPLEFVRPVKNIQDREITALIASSLAYGRVSRILTSVQDVLNRMNGSPHQWIQNHSKPEIVTAMNGFRHRFHTGTDLANLLFGVKKILEEFGSMEEAFLAGYSPDAEDISSAAQIFAERLCRFFPGGASTLVPFAARGSACKRLNLMLRWLVRSDDVDPGGWSRISPAKLLVPVDTHMYRLAVELGLTDRKTADLKTSKEITKAFAKWSPDDPVKFDFSLTRFGINPEFPRTPKGKSS